MATAFSCNIQLIMLCFLGIRNSEKCTIASSKEYLEFILEQLSESEKATYRSMMRDYILYYRGKIVGGLYDDRLFMKPVKSAVSLMPNANYEPPYAGAKDVLPVVDTDSKDPLATLFRAMYG